ncbi:MAG: hypothetical protein HY401_04145 [Elusimicrobia bacterium]|nr:hypothetical protein [Elusimicrobiota bacterium]
MAETFTDKLKLSKRDTGDLNWGSGENANKDLIDRHIQLATLRPPRTLLASLGSGAVGAEILGSATYFYKVTAFNAAGETTENQIPSVVETQVTEPSTPVPVILQWETVKGASGYRIYKSTVTGQEKFLAEVTGESTLTYTDTGNTATNGAISVPTQNMARAAVSKIVAGTNVTIDPPDGTGDVTINASGGASPADASATVKGITKLSVAPVVATDPIAAGDNDSRMTNARTPTGAAGGDLGGTYPNPAVAKLQGTAVAATPPSSGQILKFDGTQWAPQAAPSGGSYATAVVAAPTGVGATDQASIQAALDAIGSNGGTVILREGTYVMTGQATVKSKTRIMGQGMFATILRLPPLSGLTSGVFVAGASGANASASGLSFEDVGFDLFDVIQSHKGIFGQSGETIIDTQILRCRIFNEQTSGNPFELCRASAKNWLVKNCIFDCNFRMELNPSLGFDSDTQFTITNCLFLKVPTGGPWAMMWRILQGTITDNIIDLTGAGSGTPRGFSIGANTVPNGKNIIANNLFISDSSVQKAMEIQYNENTINDNLVKGPASIAVLGSNNHLIANKVETAITDTGSGNTIASSFVAGVRKLGEASPLTGDVKLEAGTNITLTQDAPGNKITIAAAGGGGGWAKVADLTLAADGLAFPTISGLNLDTDKMYLIWIAGEGVSGDPLRLEMNGDALNVNYLRRWYRVNFDNTTQVESGNGPFIFTGGFANDGYSIKGFLSRSQTVNGGVEFRWEGASGSKASGLLAFSNGAIGYGITNVTSLRVASDLNNIKAGSRVIIWKPA